MKLRLSEESAKILVRWCHVNLPKIQPLEKYNPSFAELISDRAQGNVYVFGGGSKNTIFHLDGWDCLYEYRAWHDSVHLQHNLDFSQESEMLVAQKLYEAALAMGMHGRDARLIRTDLEAHITHYYHWKKHPERQIALIRRALFVGVEEAVKRRCW